MNSTDFQLKEDFYNDIINGLQQEKRIETSDTKTNLSPIQRKNFQKKSLPLLFRAFDKVKLIQFYIENQVKEYKEHRLKNELENFVNYYASMLNNDDDEGIDDEDGAKKGKMSIIDVYNNFTKIRKVYTIFKKVKQLKDNLLKGNNDLTTIQGYDDFERELGVFINGFSDVFLKYITPFINPIVEAYHEMYMQVSNKIMNNILWGAFKAAIFDPDSFIDWALLVASLVGMFVGGVMSATGVGTPVGVGIFGASGLLFLSKVGVKMLSVFNKINRFAKGRKLMQVSSKGLKRVADNMPKNLKDYRMLRSKVKGKFNFVDKTITVMDFMDVTEEDVIEYKEMFTETSKKIGKDFDRHISGFGKNVEFVFDIKADLSSLIMGNNIQEKPKRNDFQFFSEEHLSNKYNRKIKIKGLSNLKEFKILDELGLFLDSIAYEMYIQGYDFYIKAIDQNKIGFKQIENITIFNFFDNNQEYDEMRFEKIISSDYIENGNINVQFYKEGKIVHTLFLRKGGENQRHLRQFVKTRVDETSFRRIYKGVESYGFGFIVQENIKEKQKDKTVKRITQPKDLTKYNKKINSSLREKKDFELIANEKGEFIFKLKTKESKIDSLMNQKSQELKVEEKIQKNIKVIHDKILTRLAGMVDDEKQLQKKILKKLKENKSVVYKTNKIGILGNKMSWDYKKDVEGYDEKKWEEFVTHADYGTLKALEQSIDKLSNAKVSWETKLNYLNNLTKQYLN